MKLFLEQCKEVDIVITTALIPGRPAPKLITEEVRSIPRLIFSRPYLFLISSSSDFLQMIAAMKPGSVVVDLAAEAGGNCVATVPGKLVEYKGVTVIGYTDLPSRLPTQSSTLYSNNITKFLLSMTPQEKSFGVDLKDEVVRGSIVTYNGAIVPTSPRPAPPPQVAKPNPAHDTKVAEVTAITPFQKTSREVATVTGGLGLALALGKATGPLFMGNFFTFALASLVGYRTVWGVTPALHSPLMSVTNAISGMFPLLKFSLILRRRKR